VTAVGIETVQQDQGLAMTAFQVVPIDLTAGQRPHSQTTVTLVQGQE